jgi:metal-responsive CopG/Arc/MetJ family transcriptional regulator
MADSETRGGFEGRSISLPVKLWRLLERVQSDRQDPTLSDTIRVLLLDHLAENSYLEDREKKALRITV